MGKAKIEVETCGSPEPAQRWRTFITENFSNVADPKTHC